MTYKQILRLAGKTVANDLREARADIQWEDRKRADYREDLGDWTRLNRLLNKENHG